MLSQVPALCNLTDLDTFLEWIILLSIPLTLALETTDIYIAKTGSQRDGLNCETATQVKLPAQRQNENVVMGNHSGFCPLTRKRAHRGHLHDHVLGS